MQSLDALPAIALSDYLSSQSSIFIKTYGAGGLASISMRGSAPQHTGLYWNGFNINPPNIQMADFSLLPLFLFNRIDLVSGGSSTLFGNGSMGGSVHLSSQEGSLNPHIKAVAGLGQFNDKLLAIKSGYAFKTLQFTGSFWFNKADNDHTYINTAKFGKPKERLRNADVTNVGLIQELFLPVSSRQQVRAGFWFQNREAGVPASMTMLRSVARQHDRQLRAYAQWNYDSGILSHTIKTAYNEDFLQYTDESIGLDSEILTGVWSGEVESTMNFQNDTRISAGLSMQSFEAKVDTYPENVDPFQLSVFMLAAHTLTSIPWNLTAGIRKEFHSDFNNIPPAVSLGGTGRIKGGLSGRLNLSSNYRLPTLNDRYWQPGGNPDLIPESGINAEAGLDMELQSDQLKTNFSGTLFHSKIQHLIIWLPAPEGYWKPENVSGVFIYGLELKARSHFEISKTIHQAEVSWAITKSLFGSSAFGDIMNLPQLIYTPVHIGALVYHFKLKKWDVRYNHQFTGSRFTDRANTNRMRPFQTGNISLIHTLDFSKFRLSCNLSLRNIWDAAYQVIEYRPMPGRSFHIAIVMDLVPLSHLKTKNPVK